MAKQTQEIKNKKFIKAFKRPFAIQRQEGLIKYNAKLGLKDIIIIPFEEGKVGEWYVEINQIKELYSKISNKFSSEKEFKEHINAHRKGKEDILKILKKLSLKKDPDKKELLSIYEDYNKIMNSQFAEVYSAPFAIEVYMVPELKKLLAKELEKENIEQEWSIISQPTELIEIQKLQIKISEMFLKGELDKNLSKIKQEYAWLTIYGPGDKPADEEYIKSLIIKTNKNEIEKGINELKLKINSNKKELEILLEKIKDTKLKNLLRSLNFYITFRNERMDTLRKIIYLLNPFYLRILNFLNKNESKIGYSEIINFTTEEIIEYLKKEKLPNLYKIKLRTNPENYHYYKDGEFNLVLLENEKETINRLLGFRKKEKITEFSGTISCKGVVRGKVKIISSHKDLDKIKSGDILVSDTTSPDYIIAMERAVAFVTDEGGITCHAAIVAREMNKPCITGTDIATKVLKDGDFIEVDANKGIIKILD